MAKKNGWNADEMQGSLISDMEQEVKQGYKEMNKQDAAEQHDIPAAVAMAQPGEPMQNINVPIPISLHSRLKIMAAQQRINMKDLVALAIKEYVEKQS